MNRHRILCLALCCILLGSAQVWSQGATSTIRGEVKDPQGLAIPGVTVTITSLATNSTRQQISSDNGGFRFEMIPPGEYKLEAEVSGFRKSVLGSVKALVNLPTEVTVSMVLGGVNEVVQVDALAATVAVNTQDATIGNNFVSSQITQLPLEARNVASLLTLQPGVTSSGYVAGARSDQSNVTLDGVDINEAQSNSLFGTVLRLNSEAIEEFRVTTVNANANQGRSSAAQVNLVTKSGSNEFHGSAFEFWRHESMAANNFFNNRSGIAKPALRRHTYGGTFGGPIKKDALFFFYSYEGRTDHSQGSASRIVPLATMGQGALRYTGTDGNTYTLTQAQMAAAFPTVGINSRAVQVLASAAQKYPANDFSQGDSQATRLMNTAGYRFNALTPLQLNSNVTKVDWNINNKMSAFVRANAIYDHSSSMPQFPDTPKPSNWSHPWGIVASHTWALNTNAVNSFRYGFTRQAFSNQGDSAANSISFRFVFSPLAFSRTLSRVTPVHNIVDDYSWNKGNHTWQFGTNIRIVRNSRVSYGSAFDSAITNPSFYANAGAVVSDAVDAYLKANKLPALQSVSEAQNAATALIGRFSQYSANFTYGADGKLLSSGSPTDRTFATEEYDWYLQDTWKMGKQLTLTYGLRYSLSRPVYETKGFEVKPTVTLGDYFQRRIDGMNKGVPFNDPLVLELSGPANGKSPLYRWDKNNFQPRVGVSWSPDFQGGLLGKLFGKHGDSVIRGGFAMSNDYFGQALAVLFDLNNTLGFSSNTTTSANTYNVSTKPAPLFTGFDQQVRPLPGITVTDSVKFPRQQAMDMQRRIEGGLDESLQAPTNFQWNLTFERELKGGLVFSASYIGRAARNLLATRDPMTPNNLKDPKSGMDWFTAATELEKIRATRPAGSTKVATMPYFDNVFPASLRDILEDYGGYGLPTGYTPTQAIFWIMNNYYGNDWTTIQDDIDQATGKGYFFQSQYGALAAWATVARSNYNALAISVRQRFKHNLMWDFNYTWSHSLDDASGLQNEAAFGGGFIISPLRQRESYSNSDFDMRHIINVNSIYALPFGRGQKFGSGMPAVADVLFGGWQLSGIYRFNSGLPFSAPYDDARWATNWNVQSNTTQTGPIDACPTRGNATTSPKLFGCNTATAYQSFRNAYPGEGGQRNIFHLPGYMVVDLGLSKSVKLPWKENQRLQFRWEVFNVANFQPMGSVDTSRTGYGMRLDPKVRNLAPPSNWSNFTGIQGSPRVMQFGMRLEF